MNRWGIPLLTMCWGLYSHPAGAWNYGEFISCNEINPMPAITFKTSYGKLVHDLSKTQSEIAGVEHRSNEPGWLTVGLAVAPIQMYIRSSGITHKIDDDIVCVLPKEVEIFIGYQDPAIYVSKEYKENICKFSITIRHEQVHQRINKLALDYFVPLLDKVLRKAVQDVRAVKVRSEEQAGEGMVLLNTYYQARLTPMLQEMNRAVETEQAKLDSLTSYKMQWDICEKFHERQERDRYLKEMDEKMKKPAD